MRAILLQFTGFSPECLESCKGLRARGDFLNWKAKRQVRVLNSRCQYGSKKLSRETFTLNVSMDVSNITALVIKVLSPGLPVTA